jgi:hypothetical protein
MGNWLILLTLLLALCGGPRPTWGALVSPHGALAIPCGACHATTGWSLRSEAEFNHDRDSSWPLAGRHREVACAACHLDLRFRDTPGACADCHLDLHQGALGPDCGGCHSPARWFDRTLLERRHERSLFPLTGAHRGLDCRACHPGSGAGQFAGAPLECAACHAGDYLATARPVHGEGGLGTNCAQCHSTARWATPGGFQHDAFPLLGRHAAASCVSCHEGGRFDLAPAHCAGCHAAAWQASADPRHVAAGFSQGCAVCHDEQGWRPSAYSHAAATGYELDGAHGALSCARCHVGQQYAGTSSLCATCHLADYQAAGEPAHQAPGYPLDCALCHTRESWQGVGFDHQATDFPLLDAHVAVFCVDCHLGGNFTMTPTDCFSCHQASFVETTDPAHEANLFPQDCTGCHNQTAWSPSTLDHDLTDFALSGAHLAVNCADCHTSGRFVDLPAACWACHEPDYQQATHPDHADNQFSQDCATCHSTAAWQPATFDHDLTDFPLTGAHVAVSCAACHVGGQYTDIDGACWACHEPDYQQATHPDHADNQFSQDCATCHSTAAWQPATFDHDLTDFPLTGAHVAVSCAACHVDGQYENTPSACFFCHEGDFSSADDPDHLAAQFPQDCALCHSTTQWQGAVFNHNDTGFPLTGAHTSVNCAACHLGGQYENTPTDCHACHAADYQSADSPDHADEGYPTDCAMCHGSQAGWPSAWNHAIYFPIYTGRHRDEWETCASCHLGNDLGDFSCTHCHEHRQSEMDEEHDEVAGYTWESHACLQCHPDGSDLRGRGHQRRGPDLRKWEPLR